jgi:hypothetical protein
MPDRKPVQCLAQGLPLGHEPIHQRYKVRVVRRFEQVNHLVDDNVFEALPQAGYSDSEIIGIKGSINRYLKLREIIRQASGETIDLKAYEADMRHLIDTYIQADAPRTISDFGEIGLLDLIVKTGIAEAINNMPEGIKGNKAAVAETIANNVRSKIIKDQRLSDGLLFLEGW